MGVCMRCGVAWLCGRVGCESSRDAGRVGVCMDG